MNIKDLKSSFENLKQRALKTEGQKAAAEIGKIVSAINEAAAEKNNADRYKLAMQKVYNAISKAENAMSNSENLADLHSLTNKLSSVKVGDAVNAGKAAQILRDAAEYTRMITNFKSVPEELKLECKQVASQMMKLASKIQSLK